MLRHVRKQDRHSIDPDGVTGETDNCRGVCVRYLVAAGKPSARTLGKFYSRVLRSKPLHLCWSQSRRIHLVLKPYPLFEGQTRRLRAGLADQSNPPLLIEVELDFLQGFHVYMIYARSTESSSRLHTVG